MQNQDNNTSANQQGKLKMQIKMPDEILKGVYANAMQVGHTQEEFIVDFMNLSPQQGVGIVSSRVIISPGHLKRIIAALQDNLQRYENQFGVVKIAEQPEGIGFRPE